MAASADPGTPFQLDAGQPAALQDYLSRNGLLEPGERVLACAKAGEGNMNCVVRTTTDRRRLVVKQSRPWVARYPHIPAPVDRANREMEFYQLTASIPAVARRMPRLLHGDRAAHLLVLEDLGHAADLTGVYSGGAFQPGEIAELAEYLAALHQAFGPGHPCPAHPNRELRALNHAHLFVLPLQHGNGLDLDGLLPGLRAAVQPLKNDPALVETVTRLGREVYLADGPTLIHGDAFPGSLLRTAAGLRIIDPEFAFPGRAEFDLGVFVGHLLLARQPARTWLQLLAGYRPRGGFSESLMWQVAGVEVIRRLIGFAQLPLNHPLSVRESLLNTARELVLLPGEPRVSG